MQTDGTPPSSFCTVSSAGSEPTRGRTLKRKADALAGEQEQEQERRRGRGKKRKAQRGESPEEGMSDRDAAAFTSQSRRVSQSPLTGRPILQPTPPSSRLGRSGSRSRSPVRQTIRKLEAGTPAVLLRPHSYLDEISCPAAVSDLVRLLTRDAAAATIPCTLRHRFQAQYPSTFDRTSSSAFTDAELYQMDSDELWGRVQRIQQRAQKCTRHQKDENAWCQVVNMVLDLAVDACGSALPFEVNSIQSQTLDPAFLPSTRNNPTAKLELVTKKSDFAIGLEMEATAAVSFLPLSPMADAYTQTMPMLCPLEVKRHGGDFEEAGLQLMVWQSASLSHLRFLRNRGGENGMELPPVIGWAVEGPSWKFYIAWKEESERVMVIGPFSSSDAGTADVATIFVLLGLWRKLFGWFGETYVPAYSALLRMAGDASAGPGAQRVSE